MAARQYKTLSETNGRRLVETGVEIAAIHEDDISG